MDLGDKHVAVTHRLWSLPCVVSLTIGPVVLFCVASAEGRLYRMGPDW